MNPMELIQKNIDRVLADKNWKPRDLAKAMGCSDSHVSQIRTGKRWAKRMEWETYRKVCKALEVDELELIKPPACANAGIYSKLAKEMASLQNDDVTLVYMFLAILKNREVLNPDHFKIMDLAISWLHEELIQKRGLDSIPLPPTKKREDGIEDENCQQN